MTPGALPDAALAREIAARVGGAAPLAARRFSGGRMHYVFEVAFADRPPLVVRLADEAGREAVRGAVRLSARLRPRGVPLPRLLAADAETPFPYLVLERLPGTDLGEVVGSLSPAQLERIAARVVAAQRAAAETGGRPGHYGYAASPEEAPHPTWSAVLRAHLERSRGRIAAAGRYPAGTIDGLLPLLAAREAALAAMPPVPFLHDATTKNVLVAGDGTFSGLVDVDDLCFGDPRYAAALTWASLEASGHPPTYAEAWLRHAGFSADPAFHLYRALFLADFLAEQGHPFNGNAPVPDPATERRLEALFRRTVDALRFA